MGSCASTSSERSAKDVLFFTTGGAGGGAPDEVSKPAAKKAPQSPDDGASLTETATRGRGSTISTRSITEEVRISFSQNGSIQEFLVALHDDTVANIRNHYTGVDSESRASILGKGNWGTVKIVSRKRDGQKFACKQLILSESMPNSQFEELKSEIDSLSRLDHPHLARLYEAFEEPGKKLYLVMELLTGGELFTRLVEEAPNGRFTESYAAILTKRMVSALAYLHGQGIVHRDLKLENFVFRDRDPKSDKIVLIDFGLAKRFGSSPSIRMISNSLGGKDDPANSSTNNEGEPPMEIMHSVVGSSYYIAPEVLDGKYSGCSCDMWSLGVIVYMMLSGRAPFNGKTETSIMKRAQIGEYTMEGSVWDGVSKEAKNFVTSCLTKNVNKRITAADAQDHIWVKSAPLNLNKKAKASSSPLSNTVIQNLITYAESPDLVRIGRQAVACTFSRNDVTEQAEAFDRLDGDGDGYITLEDLKSGFLSAGLEGREEFLDLSIPEMSLRVESAATRVFQAMDFQEFAQVRLSTFISASVSPDKFNRDIPLLKEAFQKLDYGHKGYIGVDDLVRLRFSEERARKIIQDFFLDIGLDTLVEDPTRDHRVEFRDFLTAMRRRGQKGKARS